MIKLALSGFLFEDNYNSQSVSFEEFCSIANSAGYDGVELRRTQININADKSERIKILEIVKKYKLEVTCLTARNLPDSGLERERTFSRYLELCRDLECKLLKISGEAVWLIKAAEKAAKCNIVLAVNNHVGSFLETVKGTKDFFKQVHHPNIKLLFDPFHLMVNGENCIDCIPEIEELTCNILMQSARPAFANETNIFKIKEKYWKKALPDEKGVQDWKRIFERFRTYKYSGLITVIENSWPDNQREYVARYYSNFIHKELINGTGT